MLILHTVFYATPKVLTKENLFINQENIEMVIISFILMTLLSDAGVILFGEIRC